MVVSLSRVVRKVFGNVTACILYVYVYLMQKVDVVSRLMTCLVLPCRNSISGNVPGLYSVILIYARRQVKNRVANNIQKDLL